jgi:hypothetical protein
MLRFQSYPDKVFTAILKDSLELLMDEINDAIAFAKDKEEFCEQLNSLLPNTSSVFNPKTTIITLKEMLVCLEKPELYYLNDYHYLLLYDTLSNLCDLHNDAIRAAETKADRKQLSQIGDYFIEELLFDEEDTFKLGMESRKSMDVSKETFAIGQGLAPHPEELSLTVYEGDVPLETDSFPYFGSKSKVYPDFNYKKGP